MKKVLEFQHNSLDPEVFANLKEKYLVTLRDPHLAHVIKQAKKEIADSIQFHADNINSEIYNYAHQIYLERLEKREKLRKG